MASIIPFFNIYCNGSGPLALYISHSFQVVMDFLLPLFPLGGYKLCRNEVKDKRGGMTKKDRGGRDKRPKTKRNSFQGSPTTKSRRIGQTPRGFGATLSHSACQIKKAKKKASKLLTRKKYTSYLSLCFINIASMAV